MMPILYGGALQRGLSRRIPQTMQPPLRTLSDYGIQSGSTVALHLRLRGGRPNAADITIDVSSAAAFEMESSIQKITDQVLIEDSPDAIKSRHSGRKQRR